MSVKKDCNATDESTGRTSCPVSDQFQFRCHENVSCFKNCCRKLELYLYPYDIIRLKNNLKIQSSELLHTYTRIGIGSHPFFPSIMLQMKDNKEHTCPFLGEHGCLVYRDRPSACRTYPLERGVESMGDNGLLSSRYFMTSHSYCRGHQEKNLYTIQQWEREQQLHDFNLMNDYWAELDAFFATNPFEGEGVAGPRQQLAFMVCYNIDGFREYCAVNRLIEQFRINKDRRRRISRSDEELLKFGFDWLQFVLGERRTLVRR